MLLWYLGRAYFGSPGPDSIILTSGEARDWVAEANHHMPTGQTPHASPPCCVLSLAARSCPTLCNPWTIAHKAHLSMGILQARILEWVAMPSSRGSSQPRDRTTLQADSLLPEPSRKPKNPTYQDSIWQPCMLCQQASLLGELGNSTSRVGPAGTSCPASPGLHSISPLPVSMCILSL